jgi:hypothetical protein
MTKPNLIAVPAKPDRIGIADRLDDLARKAALLSAAIHGLQARQFDSKDMFSGAEELAWELRSALRELSDTVPAYVEARPKEPSE